MLRFKQRNRCGKIAEQIFDFLFSEFIIFRIPLVCLAQSFSVYFIPLCLISEFIIEILIQKHFRNDLVLTTTIGKTKMGGGRFQ